MQPGMVGMPSELTGQLTDESLGIPPEDQGMGLYENLAGRGLTDKNEEDALIGVPRGRNAKGRVKSK